MFCAVRERIVFLVLRQVGSLCPSERWREHGYQSDRGIQSQSHVERDLLPVCHVRIYLYRDAIDRCDLTGMHQRRY